MTRPVVNPGILVWSGEHWINYLRPDGAAQDSGMVSLYHTHYSAAGEGTVAFVDIPGGFTGICADNRDLVRFIIETMIKGRSVPWDRPLPVFDAQLTRSGDVRNAPSWIIHAASNRIVATWRALEPPVIAEGDAPTFNPQYDFFTLLFFANDAAITLNGQPVPGKPYLRDIWQKSIGGDRSSCVFALAETMTRIPT